MQVDNLHLDGAVGAVGAEGIHGGALQLLALQMAVEIGCEVARHAEMRGGVDAVGGQVYLHHVVARKVIVFGCGGAGRRRLVGGNHDDAVVGAAHADFIFGAYHAERLHAADFRALDLKFVVAVVERGAHGGHYYGLPCGHIGGAAYDLGGLAGAEVHGGDVQVVAVGMLHAGEHLADHNSLQSALYRFHFLKAVGLQAYRGKGLCGLLRTEVNRKVIL